ncbi:DUF4123 domain-containing protein [Aquitalea sp. ASV15]|uniref:DUF4123 domain-containing protein n=1 Tax=Aquitalea sp. ASV15 TaxID=2795104 RepID=UPI0018ED9FAA|nr:DUF4123 domain-containing protein [Aquitalea sp. ASV15]
MLNVIKTQRQTAAEWLDELLTHVQQIQKTQLFAMIDLAQDQHFILQTIQYHSAAPSYRLLLENTIHHMAAEAGPVLIAFQTTQEKQVKLLLELIQLIKDEPRLILFLAEEHVNLDQLAKRLTQAMQVELNEGIMPMIFRFYDPRCIHIALSNLSPAEFKFIFEPIHAVHWQDRDGVSCRINRPDELSSLPDWPHQVLHLSDGSVQALSAWQQAERWQQTHESTPDSFGLDNKESMMKLLYKMQLLADEKNMLSEPERNAFIHEQLQNTSKTNNHIKSN